MIIDITQSHIEKHRHTFLFVLSIIYLSIALFPKEQNSLIVVTFNCLCRNKNIQSWQLLVGFSFSKMFSQLFWEIGCLLQLSGNNPLFSLYLKKKRKTCSRITIFVPPVNGAVGLSFISFRAFWPCLPSLNSATTFLFSFASPWDLPLCLLVLQCLKQWKVINRGSQSQKLVQLYCCAYTMHLVLDKSRLDLHTVSLLNSTNKHIHMDITMRSYRG